MLCSCDALSLEIELELFLSLGVFFLKEFLFKLTNVLVDIFQQDSYRVLVLWQVINEDVIVSIVVRGGRLVITTVLFGLLHISSLGLLPFLWLASLDVSLNERIIVITQMAIIKLVFEVLLFELIDFVVIV